MHSTLTSVKHKKWLLFKTLLPHVILLVLLDFMTKAYLPLVLNKEATSAELFYAVSSILLTFIVSVSIAVKTHRVLLLNEDGLHGLEFSRFKYRELSFLFTSILLGLITGGIIFIFTFIFAVFKMVIIGSVIGVVLALVIVSRLTIVLPSIAVDKKMSFKEAWNLTKEFKWMSFYVIILFPTLFCFIVTLVYGYIINYLSLFLGINLDVFYVFLNLLLSIFVISALSVMYSHIHSKMAMEKTEGQ